MRTVLLTGALFLLPLGSVRAQPPQPPAPALPALTGAYDPAVTAPPGAADALTAQRPFDMDGPRFWATGDYMLMWYNPMRAPPLIQSVPSALADLSLPATNATTVFPENKRIDFGAFNGVRVSAGANFQTFGIEASGFELEQRGTSGSAFNNGFPTAIAQSYISAGSGTPILLLSSLPNQYAGGVSAVAHSKLWGAEGGARRGWYALFFDTIDLLAGFKYLNLRESLDINATSVFPGGGSVGTSDTIRTRNTFYGAYVGFNGRLGGWDRGFGLDLTSKSALGGVAQRADLAGSNTFISAAGVRDTEAGGLYARGLNAGAFSRGKFAYAHDLDLKLTYNFNPWFQVSFGYSLTYLSSVMRPGRAIDPVVNDSNVRFIANPTPSDLARPAFAWRTDGFVVQGLTFGARMQY